MSQCKHCNGTGREPVGQGFAKAMGELLYLLAFAAGIFAVGALVGAAIVVAYHSL